MDGNAAVGATGPPGRSCCCGRGDSAAVVVLRLAAALSWRLRSSRRRARCRCGRAIGRPGRTGRAFLRVGAGVTAGPAVVVERLDGDHPDGDHPVPPPDVVRRGHVEPNSSARARTRRVSTSRSAREKPRSRTSTAAANGSGRGRRGGWRRRVGQLHGGPGGLPAHPGHQVAGIRGADTGEHRSRCASVNAAGWCNRPAAGPPAGYAVRPPARPGRPATRPGRRRTAGPRRRREPPRRGPDPVPGGAGPHHQAAPPQGVDPQRRTAEAVQPYRSSVRVVPPEPSHSPSATYGGSGEAEGQLVEDRRVRRRDRHRLGVVRGLDQVRERRVIEERGAGAGSANRTSTRSRSPPRPPRCPRRCTLPGRHEDREGPVHPTVTATVTGPRRPDCRELSTRTGSIRRERAVSLPQSGQVGRASSRTTRSGCGAVVARSPSTVSSRAY